MQTRCGHRCHERWRRRDCGRSVTGGTYSRHWSVRVEHKFCSRGCEHQQQQQQPFASAWWEVQASQAQLPTQCCAANTTAEEEHDSRGEHNTASSAAVGDVPQPPRSQIIPMADALLCEGAQWSFPSSQCTSGSCDVSCISW